MYTAEQTFIKELENYFDEKFNDFTHTRIARLLREYVDTVKKAQIEKERRLKQIKGNKEEVKIEQV